MQPADARAQRRVYDAHGRVPPERQEHRPADRAQEPGHAHPAAHDGRDEAAVPRQHPARQVRPAARLPAVPVQPEAEAADALSCAAAAEQDGSGRGVSVPAHDGFVSARQGAVVASARAGSRLLPADDAGEGAETRGGAAEARHQSGAETRWAQTV